MTSHFSHGRSRYARISGKARTSGFTLIELMVGLLLGMLTVLVITQVLALAEGKKRTITTGSDAQLNGALAIYTLQRDLQMAGYGLSSKPEAIGCPLNGTLTIAGSPSVTEAYAGTLVPVEITQGTNGGPDTLTLLQARKSGFSVPIVATAQSSDYFTVLSSLGAKAGDLMAAVPTAWSASVPCRLFSVTDDGAGSTSNTGLWALRVPHVEGGGISWNDNAALSLIPAAYLLNLGNLGYSQYSVNANLALQLTTRTATAASSTSELFPQIVNLQALYGKDTNNDGVVDKYDHLTPTTNAGWREVLAIRIAVVARSTQYGKSAADEHDAVTQANPVWDLGASTTVEDAADCHGDSKCLSIKVDHLPDWKHYRYKVYDTIVPLRNVIWNTAS